MTGKFKIANLNIEIDSIYEDVIKLCKDYETQEQKIDFTVKTTKEDVEFEKKKSAKEDKKANRPIRKFTDGYLETLAVYRKIANELPKYNGFLIHGSCIAVDNIGYLFIAKSGTGKSTHTRLWRELLKERAVMVNDDKPLVRINDDGEVVIYGTPWDGKHHLSKNIAVPLKSICILEQGKQNEISKITLGEAYIMLLQQIYKPEEIELLEKTINLIDKLGQKIRFYKLKCVANLDAAELAYYTIK